MKYNSPPIKEAILDIRINQIEDTSPELFDDLYGKIRDDFPRRKKQISFDGKIVVNQNEQIDNKFDTNMRGFIFSNAKDNRKVQMRIDGFTFNMLKPYSEWEDFSNEAFRLWKIYNNIAMPKKVVRIALRYINSIEIPIPFQRFQDYIINMPPIPTCLPQKIRNFFMQIVVPYDNKGTNVILTQTIDKPNKLTLPFILDIDAFRTGEINNDIDTLTLYFDELRELKNNTFESCITDNTRNLFE